MYGISFPKQKKAYHKRTCINTCPYHISDTDFQSDLPVDRRNTLTDKKLVALGEMPAAEEAVIST